MDEMLKCVRIRDVLSLNVLHVTSPEKQYIVQIGWVQGRSDMNRYSLGSEIKIFLHIIKGYSLSDGMIEIFPILFSSIKH